MQGFAEEFAKLQWRIPEPSVLDVDTKFIKEENIIKSYVFNDSFKPDKLNVNKQNNKKFQTQYVPKTPKYPHNSNLTKSQHFMCLKALEILQANQSFTSYSKKDQSIITEYNNLKPEIQKENARFLQYIEKLWGGVLCNRIKQLPKRMINFAKARWKLNIENLNAYDQFYIQETVIPLSGGENPVEILHERCLLELGTVAKIKLPELENNAKMFLNTFPSLKEIVPQEEVLRCTKIPVSGDIFAENLAKENDCDIAISSSGLKTIIDNYGPDYNANWDIPVLVKTYEVNGINKKIIYVDKPLPHLTVSLKDVNVKCRKILLKTNLCQEVAHRFQTPVALTAQILQSSTFENVERTVSPSKVGIKDNINKQKPVNQATNTIITRSVAKKIQDLNYSDSSDHLDDFSEVQKVTSKMSEPNQICELNQLFESNQVTDSNKMFEKNQFTDLSQILESEKLEESQNSGRKNVQRKKCTAKLKLHHNVSYHMWKLNVETEKNSLLKGCENKKNIKLLVRCKMDGCEVDENGSLKPVTLVPKVEYQCEYGAEMLTKSEILRQWTNLYFRPFSTLIRVRMNGTNRDYNKIERVTLTKLANESLRLHNFTPSFALNTLYTVLSKLTDLEPGHYILRHTPQLGPFATLMKNLPNGISGALNLHELYREVHYKIEKNARWCPIDTTIVLPYHSKFGFMPGLFPPQINYKTFKGGAKGKTHFKKKGRNKIAK